MNLQSRTVWCQLAAAAKSALHKNPMLARCYVAADVVRKRLGASHDHVSGNNSQVPRALAVAMHDTYGQPCSSLV